MGDRLRKRKVAKANAFGLRHFSQPQLADVDRHRASQARMQRMIPRSRRKKKQRTNEHLKMTGAKLLSAVTVTQISSPEFLRLR